MTVDLDHLCTLHQAVTNEELRLAEHNHHDENSQRDRVVWAKIRFQQALRNAAPDLFDELDALRAEVERLRGERDETTLCWRASQREVERLRGEVAALTNERDDLRVAWMEEVAATPTEMKAPGPIASGPCHINISAVREGRPAAATPTEGEK